MLAAGMAGVIVLAMTLYVMWMPVGYSRILFFSPSYLTPFALVFLLCLFNPPLARGRVLGFVQSHLGALVVVYFVIRYGESVWLLLWRFYGFGA